MCTQGVPRSIPRSIQQYYTFYEYVANRENTHIEGVIDWDNWYTTLMESNSGYDEWSKHQGIAEKIIDVSIKKGLNLSTPVLLV